MTTGTGASGYSLGQELGTLLSSQEENVYSNEVLEKLAAWHYTQGVAQGTLVVVPLERMCRVEDPRTAFITEFVRGFRTAPGASRGTGTGTAPSAHPR